MITGLPRGSLTGSGNDCAEDAQHLAMSLELVVVLIGELDGVVGVISFVEGFRLDVERP